MSNTFTAPFVQKYKTQSAVVTTALGGIGSDMVVGAQLLTTAGVNGAVVSRITAMPRGTVTATSLVLFVVKTDGLYRIKDSELMPAYTLAPTTAIPETTFGNISSSNLMYLEAGDSLYVGSQVALAAGIVFSIERGDL